MSVFGCGNCGCDTENEPLVLCDECNSEPDVSPDGLRAQLRDALEDLKDLRRDRDSMKAWAASLFAHVCRLTKADPKSAPQEIKAIADSHAAEQAAGAMRVAEAVREACAREVWAKSQCATAGELGEISAAVRAIPLVAIIAEASK
jgi:hypothetical protein